MTPSLTRRAFSATSLPFMLAVLSRQGVAATDKAPLHLGPARPFSFAWLRQRAHSAAISAYVSPPAPQPDLVDTIDFDASQKIRFRADCALWKGTSATYPLRFFHLNKFVPNPVRLHAVEGRKAREILYSPRCFDYNGLSLAQKLQPDLGYAGFRVMDGQKVETDWLAFQGASYFRTSGQDNQYGASARGIAVNTALSTVEEFPRFSEFWIAESPGTPLTIYALLEGPSLTGAYKFEAVRGNGVVMDVHAELFIRTDVTRLGIAPLTSMYWYGENERTHAVDWRPEIHDSDGLALWTGGGERIWRPLIDPPRVQTNSFVDTNPKGFGLMQRDRKFENYEDDGAFYNRRPGIWVEPRGNWGAGAVQLVEIPTDDEIHDNIVAYWQPSAPIKAGDQPVFDYRLYWQDSEPHPPHDIAEVVTTRIGRGGIPGRPSPKGQWKFVIDFQGGTLDAMPARYDVSPIVTLSRGKAENRYVIRVVGTNTWRAFFDVNVTGRDPLDLRCYLKLGDKTLSETWLYQFFPPA
ncbi:MAG TPA: glucan biosynthesis protein [Rhizomicrobium sp.]|jgi:glucans biosynthesis protein